ncbi:hypothetical protein F7725_017354 [Dissostichus mawsoni]|uniref:Uncharacterized protein n=1 Tax=Dissostichus mawsoni TaxID=36200 RepID=A0A7J5Z665_DISMA|nr:hypothetical protein F7725_017354 [Dissostichus mawsoni]
MADDVLLREPDREGHPVSVLTSITLLSENRFVTPEELDSLIAYLNDKEDGCCEALQTLLQLQPQPTMTSPPQPQDCPPPPHSTHNPPQSSHLGLSAASSAAPNSSHQQELQAKILSLFNSGLTASQPPPAPQPKPYGSLGPPPLHESNTSTHAWPHFSPGLRRPAGPHAEGAGHLIQSGPSLNHLVGSSAPQQPPPRSSPGMGQAPPMSMYPRHY